MNISLLSQNASQTCVSNRFFNTSSLSPLQSHVFSIGVVEKIRSPRRQDSTATAGHLECGFQLPREFDCLGYWSRRAGVWHLFFVPQDQKRTCRCYTHRSCSAGERSSERSLTLMGSNTAIPPGEPRQCCVYKAFVKYHCYI